MFADTPEQKDRVFLILTGIWLFTALLLFGNPVILDYLHPVKDIGIPTQSIGVTPEDNSNARPYLGILAVLGLACVLGFSRLAKPKFQLPDTLHLWIAWLPLGWFGWQLASLLQTVDRETSMATVIHFGSCVVAFYLGLFVLARMRLARLVLWGAALGLMANLLDASREHFGGLEQTRREIIERIESGKLDPAKVAPHLREEKKDFPPEVAQQIEKLPAETAAKIRQFPVEMVKRWYSPRLFGHMFYPNALAGVILLLLPVSLALLLGQARWGPLRFLLALGLAGVGLGCLYWSGSKAGWLIALVLLGAWLLHFPFSTKLKIGLASAAMVIGLAGFAVKYADYFDKGATSVGARFGYWSAAVKTAAEEPFLGSGPGTFQVAYKRHRPPEAEPTRLTHNDYLQQASDSGVPGFLIYLAFFGGATWVLARRRMAEPVHVAMRLGLLAWVLQGAVEFGLYIPALAWPAWLILGWLLALPTNHVDKSTVTE
ncbi:MAG TPA: hypothetical protein DGJ56_06590 [Verrucomicrobiales bacterium]|nr:hypothetical protein [Verrucomicrobiales bacterium]